MIYRTRIKKFQCLILFFFALLGLQANAVYAQCDFTPKTNCAGDACSTNPTQFTYTGPGTQFEWDFGDTEVQTDTSSQQNPTYLYTRPGSYTVTLKVDGVANPGCTQTVTINGFSEFTLDPDINKGKQEEEICKEDLEDGVILTPKFTGTQPTNPTYLWSTGESTPTIQIDTAGCYSVTITDPVTGCSRTNKVTVTSYKPDPNVPPPPQEKGQWFFGNGAGIKFEGNPPKAITGGQVNVPEGSSTVSNTAGQLLFYTDGRTVYKPDGTVMDGGDNLGGGTNVTQGVLIVSQPGCASCNTVYYVFTISDAGALQYSVVDMRANNGAGAVLPLQKNIPLFPTSTERVTAIAAEPDSLTGANKTWVITHDDNTNTFRVYPFDAKGIGSPVTSEVGAIHGPDAIKGESYMKPSPDGTKLAVVIPGGAPPDSTNLLQIFDFDKKTGKLSNPKTVDLGPTPPSAYGVEFSSDTTLYVTLTGDAAKPSQLLQYSVRSSDSITIANSRKVIATSPQKYGALQIDPDKQKIYLAIAGATSLGVINQPNDTLNVDFKENGFPLEGPTSQLGLPNVSPTETPPGFGQGFDFDGPECAALGEQVTYQFQASPDRAPRNDGQPNSFYRWVFPDGSTSAAQNPSYVFPGPGTYTVKLNIWNDCIAEPGEAFQKTITIKRAPDPFQIQPTSPNTVRQNGNITTCQPSVVLDAQANVPGSIYQWFLNGTPVQVNGTSRTLTVTQPGVYTVLLANGSCGRRDQVNVIFSAPQVNLGADTTLCGGSGQLVLNAGNPGSAYVWRLNGNEIGGETGQTLVVNVAAGETKTYSVTVTNPAQPTCPGTDEIVVRGGSPSVITATSTPTTSTCAGVGTNTGTITLTIPATGGPFTYVWNGPGVSNVTTQNLINLAAGVYQVTVTNAAGCQTVVQASVNSSQSTLDYKVASPVTASCSNPATGTLQAFQSTSPVAAISFIWRNSNGQEVGNSNSLTAAPGIYSVELTDAVGCKQFISNLEITRDNSQPVVKASPPVIIGCNNINLYASASGGNYFVWRKITTDNVISPPIVFSSGTNQSSIINPPITQTTEIERYTVSVWTDLAAFNAVSPCFGTDTITVVRPRPLDINTMIAASPTAACEGETITLEAVRPPAGATYQYTYQWKQNGNDIEGATAQTFQVITSGQYQVTIRIPEYNCLPVTSSFRTITINTIPVITFEGANPVNICRGDATTLSAQMETGTNYSYRWVNKTTGQQVGLGRSVSVEPLATTIYVLTVSNGTAPNNCISSKEITVNVTPKPFVDFTGQPQIFCEGSSVVLNATNPNGATYEWKLGGNVIAGQTGPTLRVNQAGTYSVTVTIGQCSFTAQHIINPPLKTPVPAIPRKVVEFCFREDPGSLATVDAGPGNLLQYEWFNLDNPTVKIGDEQTLPLGPGSYVIKYTNNEKCSVFDTILVLDKCTPRVFVPEAFTPNGDGNNDVFVLRHPGFVRNLEFRIYNRWGEVVAVTRVEEPSPDGDGSLPIWDGTFKGQSSPVGSYVWTLSYESIDFPERGVVKLRGGLVLIR